MSDGLFSLAGRTAVVTGGLGQLGRQFTEALVAAGARVAVLDARPSETASDDRVLFVQADVTRRESLEAAADRIESVWDTPHVLINNAALDSPPGAPASANGAFENYPAALWREILDVNVTGVFLCSQVIGGRMARAGRGSIVNVASIYGMVSPDQRIYEYRRQGSEEFFKPAAYATSKSALLNLTRYLATYWASRGVRVNTVTFAGVFNNQDERFLAEYSRRVPLARMARPDEYNGAIVFLASEASSYMTGANLVLDGGYTAW
ncbi:MAG TPA: SDR family oxidoreductase [Gemmatimonadaceae bacterium]|nr:SDR family oxidoreductase [Gemmatimonadaceae bacterium]